MNSLTSKALISVIAAAPLLANAEQHRFFDYAKVREVKPTYQSVAHRIPQEDCWVERVRTERHPRSNTSATSTLVGGVIGGAIGHAVGHGKDNKKIGAVVGSMLGLSIGRDIGRRQHRHGDYPEVFYDDVERCETSYRTETEERLTGYRVTYQYRGEVYTTHMDEHPGQRIKVAVSVRPVKEY